MAIADYTVVKGIDLFFKKYDYSLLQVNFGGIKRTFCKCGHSEKSIIYNCPKCGSNKHTLVRVYDSFHYKGGILQDLYEIKYDKTKTTAKFHVENLVINPNSAKKEFKVEEGESKDIASIEKGELKVLDINSFNMGYYSTKTLDEAVKNIEEMHAPILTNFDFESFRKEYKFFDKDFDIFNFKDYYNSFQNRYLQTTDMRAYFSYISLKNRIPSLFNTSNVLTVFITQLIVRGHISDIKKNSTIKQIISSLKLNDFEEYINKKWFYANDNKKIDLSVYNGLNKEQKEMISYAVGHYNMSIDKIEGLSISIKEKADLYDGRIQPLFLGFIKSNLVIFMDSIIDEFEKRINFLNKHKIPIDESSIKNYSFYKNLESLKEEKYPEKNINLVADIFYDNPLMGMKYLKSIKPFTKKEIKDITSKIIK